MGEISKKARKSTMLSKYQTPDSWMIGKTPRIYHRAHRDHGEKFGLKSERRFLDED
jgi:hypothetical protein